VLPEFLIGKHKWRFDENGKLEPAQPLQEDEIYFEKITRRTRGGDDYDTFKFKYRKCYKFLSRRGFGRYEYGGQDKYTWVHIENRIVKEIVPHKVRDYVLEFTEAIAEQADIDEVMDMFFRGSKMYLGPDSLSHLSYVYPHFETSEKDSQIMFFRDKYWMITAEGIEEHPMGDLKHMVWKDKVREFDARLVAKEFNVVTRIDDDFLKANPAKAAMLEDYKGQFDIIASKEARECHFQQFLINTGEFFWDKFIDNKEGWKPKLENGKPVDTRSLAEKFETNLHFLSKTTAFGFLLHHYRDKSCEKAVIGMDGKIGVVGDSNGRSGKSIFGFGLAEVVPKHVIPGKAKDLMEDKFLLEGVTEKTENIFINDVRANFDFEFLFPLIEDKLVINAKGSQKYTLPKSSIQKFYIATNHAINGDTGSYRDRQHLIAFSDYYNENHKPVDDFGVTFFDAWDDIQRNLFYNYAAYALHLYFKAARMGWGVNGSGLIQCPVQRLERRKLRQFIGETFLTWADEYYGAGDDIREADIGQDPGTGLPITNSHINTRIFRKELWDDFIENNKQESKYMNAHKFKKKLIAWCKFRGLAFNPQKQEFDGMISDDKSGGKEFFTVANSRYAL